MRITAILTSPTGEVFEYTVTADSKAAARKKVANLYRRDTPSWRNGFYSFSRHRLTWGTIIKDKD